MKGDFKREELQEIISRDMPGYVLAHPEFHPSKKTPDPDFTTVFEKNGLQVFHDDKGQVFIKQKNVIIRVSSLDQDSLKVEAEYMRIRTLPDGIIVSGR